MRVAVFGATGMVGQGVLRECLLDHDIEQVLSIGRTATGQVHPRLRDVVVADLLDYSAVAADLERLDACFFCLGVTSAGMNEDAYRRVTVDITVAAGEALARSNPGMKFVFVSGAGTDSSGTSRTMWARVKGEAENALLRMPLDAFMFRPAFIQPLHGIRSKTASYRFFYALTQPMLPLLKVLFRPWFTTTAQLGRAMIAVAKRGAPRRVLESRDINEIAV